MAIPERELAPLPVKPVGADIERVLIQGDLSSLKPEQRLEYYQAVCRTVGLNPLTRPFEYITLNGKLVLYARRDATDQLRSLKHVSVSNMQDELVGDVYRVRATFTDRNGRTDMAHGAVSVVGLKGEALANAYMKAETKCKRRGTLSICGLGMFDESEIEDQVPPPPISEEQRAEIEAMMTKAGLPWEPLLTFFSIQAIGELPADKFERAKRAIEANTKKGAKGAAGNA